MIQALVFDFDGLIFDTEGALFEVWAEIYREHGQELPLDQWALNVGGEEYEFFNPFEHLVDLSGRALDQLHFDEMRRHRYHRKLETMHAMDGVAACIEWAKRRGLKLAVASNSTRSWVHGYLDQLGLRRHFGAIACGDEGEPQKPDPGIYKLALRRLRVPGAAALALEDSPRGVAAAKAAGMWCAAVPNRLTAGLDLDHADWRLSGGMSPGKLEAIFAEAAARDAV